MAKSKKKKDPGYECEACGAVMPRWVGRCPSCDGWGTVVERAEPLAATPARAGAPTAATPITQVSTLQASRQSTGIGELDRVLGGGLVSGTLVLIGGDPGIGKSTLLLDAAKRLATGGAKALYVSAEESAQQVRLRAERIDALSDSLLLLADRSLEAALNAAEAALGEGKLAGVVLDSVQTLFSDALENVPGSLPQVREVAAKAMALAKTRSVPVFLVGHVTKEGSLAGPKVLEHLVDTVLYFEGERGHQTRLLRAHKNRFGSTNEVGVFEMEAGGLREVSNPSALFLSERPEGGPGSVVSATLEGNRPLLVEVQSLVSACAYGTPRRTAVGADAARVALLGAVLEKRVAMPVLSNDIFINVAGGLKLSEPATDLAVVAAMASSFTDRDVDPRLIVFGEVGLSGEVRAVGGVEARLEEAARLGFERAIIPASGYQRLDTAALKRLGIDAVPVGTLRELLAVLF